MAAEKAVKQETWDTIEWLFAPRTHFEMFLRWDFEGACEKFDRFFAGKRPETLPCSYRIGKHAIEREAFYRQMRTIREPPP